MLIGSKKNIGLPIVIYIPDGNACSIIKVTVLENVKFFCILNAIVEMNSGFGSGQQLKQRTDGRSRLLRMTGSYKKQEDGRQKQSMFWAKHKSKIGYFAPQLFMNI